MRNTGISEGFTGQGMGACSCGGGFVPQRGPVSKKFAKFLFGGKFLYKVRAPHFPTQGYLVKVFSELNPTMGYSSSLVILH